LLVYASNKQQARQDWWLVNRDSHIRCLTAEMSIPPAQLIAESGSQTFVGLADGNLWRIHLDRSAPENLTANLEPKLTAIVFPGESRTGDSETTSTIGAEFSTIIASAQQESLTDFYWIGLVSGELKQLSKPTSSAIVAGYDPQGETILFSARDRTGTYLWATQRTEQISSLVLETNTFLRDIVAGEIHLFDYRSLDGETLKAALLLPPDYQPEQTYPMVAWVYPGQIVSSPASRSYEINNPNPFNMQLLAAQGYMVLEPSIPLKPEGDVDDPMLRLINGILPAVEQAIALGFADPNRLFLMGQSFGGYATYGLITQTHRFKAAVALAGLSNLISLYGLFDARQRYEEVVHEDLFAPTLLEVGQLRMGSPPWNDLDRYIRNSPIFAVDQVQTPLMILQGDMDYVPIQQGEEFFRGLQRQGKRAAFVRYWGEGHVIASPANIKDMWQRILAWFGEFSGNE
jgi:dipeptidyl aminopeptidase/acylaminoacyl peptidase